MKEAVKNPLTSAYEVGRSLNEMKAMPLSVECGGMLNPSSKFGIGTTIHRLSGHWAYCTSKGEL
jgi:hypothetical protein